MIGRIVIFLLLAGMAGAQDRLAPLDEAAYQKLVASAKGKVLLVDFWATWCSACRAEMPELIKLNKKLQARGFQLTLISADEQEQAADALKVVKQAGAPMPSYLKQAKNDEKFINSIDPKWSGALPGLFLYDKTGRKVQSFIGETGMKTLEAAIEKLL